MPGLAGADGLLMIYLSKCYNTLKYSYIQICYSPAADIPTKISSIINYSAILSEEKQKRPIIGALVSMVVDNALISTLCCYYYDL